MKRQIIAVLVFFLFILSCRTTDYSIENRRWFLEEIEGDREIVLLNDKLPYIEFDLESSKIGGNASCNSFFTDYIIEGNSVQFGLIVTTLMACQDDTNQEHRFLQAMSRIETYEIIENKLFLYEGNEAILIFNSGK